MLLRKKEEIEIWLNKYNITNYELIEDKEYSYVVNVNDDLDLGNKKLKSINIKFNIIDGFFNITYNQLKSLEGCPKIVNGYFICSYNELTSLKFSPEIIKDSCWFSFNKIKELNVFPIEINGNYCYLSNNELTIDGLKNLPNIKGKFINLSNNEKLSFLQSIKHIDLLKEKVDEILKLKNEKNNLLNIINQEELNKNKINKI